VNPRAGRETEFAIEPARERKRVLIAGGGPGGMEAARVAALRGHEVILCEKSDKLGGQFRLACASPHKDEFENFIRYLECQLRKHGVKVELGKEVTLSLIGELKPDVIIVATGALPYTPHLPGVDRENVFLPQDILSGEGRLGERVIIVGGGLIGIDTAAFLAGKGKKITITSRRDEVGWSLIGILKDLLVSCLKERFGVRMLPKSALKEILPTKLILERDGKEEILEGDTFIIAAGMIPNTALQNALIEDGTGFYAIGDCVNPRDALAAVAEGAEIATKI
jgi:NADPH-dependent 2,4-dienoyl-CoA reductase/sulfur reductase-like enzyme